MRCDLYAKTREKAGLRRSRVTSQVQGNCSRLIWLKCFLSFKAVRCSPASYCRFHSASAQFQTKRLVPAALAKYAACAARGMESDFVRSHHEHFPLRGAK